MRFLLFLLSILISSGSIFGQCDFFMAPFGTCFHNEYRLIVSVESGEGPFELEIMLDGEIIITDQLPGVEQYLYDIDGPGEYSATLINEATGCNDETLCTVDPFELLEITFEVDTAFCGGDLANIYPLVSAGIEPLFFFWPQLNISNDTVIGVPGGTYNLLVQDGAGCEYTFQVYTGPEEALEADISVNQPTCDADDGAITIDQISGGQPPYTIAWSNSGDGQVIDNLPPGEYSVTITDDFDCSVERSFTLAPTIPVSIDIDFSGTDPCDESFPVLQAEPFNENYLYEWSGPEGFTAATSSVATSVAGTYTLLITYPSDGCNGLDSVEVVPNEEVFLDIINFAPFCTNISRLVAISNSSFDSQVWTFNGDTIGSSPFVDITESGWYFYTASNNSTGCTIADSALIITPEAPCDDVTGRLWAIQGGCELNGTEMTAANTMIRIDDEDGQAVAYVSTDSDGIYATELNPGTYTATPLPVAEDLYFDCGPQIIEVDAEGQAVTDLFIRYEEACPVMSVSVTAPLLERCLDSNAVYLEYCNNGPMTATDAVITVSLDEYLTFDTASTLPASIMNGLVTFAIGDLPPFSCETITMYVSVSCEAVTGQTHCLSATATPNDPCPTPTGWNGANLEVGADCLADSLEFIITNTGTAPLSQPLQYIVIEDGVMMFNGVASEPALNAGEQFRFRVPANGSTYRLTTNQEPDNPAFGLPTITVEGCGTNGTGTFSLGYVNQMPLNDADVFWYDLACRENTGSFGINNQIGLPLGVDEPNFIDVNTPIVYDVFVQNDNELSVNSVTIRDTIAPEFDLNSLRVLAASHDYTFSVDSNRVLKIQMQNAQLNSSAQNLAESQAAIAYYIQHQSGLAVGTELRNQAAIYFDLDAPIYTENTLHTLGENFLPSSVNSFQRDLAGLMVYPNPVGREGQVTFVTSLQGAYRLDIFNTLGENVNTSDCQGGALSVRLNGLHAGHYLARLTAADGRMTAVRKFILK